MSIETDRMALSQIQELADKIKQISQSQSSIEYVNWENITDDLLYFQSSLNLELARLDEHSQD